MSISKSKYVVTATKYAEKPIKANADFNKNDDARGSNDMQVSSDEAGESGKKDKIIDDAEGKTRLRNG